MTFKSSKDLKMILHPYVFILKGGKEFNENLMDYQLIMLQINSPETIKSPSQSGKIKLNGGKTFCLSKSTPLSTKEQGFDQTII